MYVSAGWKVFPTNSRRYSGGGLPSGHQEASNYAPAAPQSWSIDPAGNPRNDCAVWAAPGLIGIDVDHYGDKRGQDTIDELERKYGQLPATVSSTSRGARQPARIYWFRVPEGDSHERNQFVTKLRDVEIIQSHHRFGAVYPSVSHKTGETYRWFSKTDEMLPETVIPSVEDCAELTAAWVEFLREGSNSVAKRQSDLTWQQKIDVTLDYATGGDPCNVVLDALERYSKEDGSHYDRMVKTTLDLLRRGEQGHAGVRTALSKLQEMYVPYADEQGREGLGEFERQLAGAGDVIFNGEPSADRNGCRGMLGCGVSDALVITGSDFSVEEERRCWNRDKLLPSTAAAVITDRLPVRVSPSGELTAWVNGYWNEERSKNTIHRHVVALLGDRYTQTADGNICAVLQASDDSPEERDTEWLNVANGLLNWKTGVLWEHTPDHDSDYQFPVEFDPAATAPRFERFLAEVLHKDDVETVLRMFGYCLFRGYPIHKAFMLTGSGSNGKSLLLKTLVQMLGKRNTSGNSPQSFGAERFSVGDLHGKFANIAFDVSSERFVDTAAWKQLTSGDEVRFE
ncbi:bifunctional DNA primase/polymerase [Pseudonocardia sp. T1-2H]|uniref:bifunctional DNA primase/polymerase n=1 Tax=Pseudonocardia sp. T1-2H TaxID=3128899 RepID=UPI0031011CDF